MILAWERMKKFFGAEKRIATTDAYFGAFINQRSRVAASSDGAISALGVAAACIARRAQGLASVPLIVHRTLDPSNAGRADDHPLYDVLNTYPNDYQSAFEFREFMARSHDLFGNAYARIERDSRGQVAALHPFAPMMVALERLPNGRLRYRGTDFVGREWTLTQDEVLHVRGPSRNGIYGLSPLQIANEAVSLALSANDFARSYFDNSSTPDGYIKYPAGTTLKAGQTDEVRKYWVGKFSAKNRFAGPAVLTDGGEFAQLNINAADAQLIETRRYSAEEIARIFDCPPTSVGIVQKATYSNTEQEALALVRNCLTPLAARFESAFARCLLTTAGRRSYFFRHNFNELMRGDMETRFNAYRVAREIGAYSPNDIRRLENEAAIPGGDQYSTPANWLPLDQARNGAVPGDDQN